MHQQYCDTHTDTVNTWQQQAAPSERFPYGLGLSNDEYLANAGIYPFREDKPDYDPDTHELVADAAPVVENGEAVLHFHPVPKIRTLDEHKAAAKAQVTARRWQVETGGVSLPDGTKVATGIDDQNRIASALQGMTDAGIAEVDFKAETGWVKLTREQLAGVAALIAGHVQACFSRERALHELVDATETVEELAAIDINAGWPGQTAGGTAGQTAGETPENNPAPEAAA